MSDRPLPLLVGPANCEAMTGMPWRHIRDHAEELGLTFVSVGNKRAIVAADLLVALAGRASREAAPAEVDELEAMRRRLGKQRIG